MATQTLQRPKLKSIRAKRTARTRAKPNVKAAGRLAPEEAASHCAALIFRVGESVMKKKCRNGAELADGLQTKLDKFHDHTRNGR